MFKLLGIGAGWSNLSSAVNLAQDKKKWGREGALHTPPHLTSSHSHPTSARAADIIAVLYGIFFRVLRSSWISTSAVDDDVTCADQVAEAAGLDAPAPWGALESVGLAHLRPEADLTVGVLGAMGDCVVR